MSVSIEIKVSVPEIVLNSDVVRFSILSKMQRKTGPDLLRMFEMTTRGWTNRPNFLQRYTNRVDKVSVRVWPSQSNKAGKIYSLVSNGALKHDIVARRGRMLVFRRGYLAATSPRILSSGKSHRYGDIVRTPAVFNHPGFPARKFEETIKEEYQDTFEKDMQEAIHVATVRGIK